MKNQFTPTFVPLTQATRRRQIYCLWLRLNQNLRKAASSVSSSSAGQQGYAGHDGRHGTHNLS